MPYKEKEIEKLYFTIGEVAKIFDVNTSHIRFWSKEFEVIKPATNKKGNRLYTQSDIDNFKKIYHLVKEKGFTLKGAKVELKTEKQRMPKLFESENGNGNGQVAERDHAFAPSGYRPDINFANGDQGNDNDAVIASLQKVKKESGRTAGTINGS